MGNMTRNIHDVHVRTMGDTLFVSRQSGTVDMLVMVGNQVKPVQLSRVLHLKGATRNLLSVSAMAERGFRVSFTHQGCKIVHARSGTVIATGTKRGGLYILDQPKHPYPVVGGPRQSGTVSLVADAKPELNTVDVWHRRLGHVDEATLRQMAEDGAVVGLHLKADDRLSFCESCALGKSARKKFPKGKARRAKELLGLVHMDVWGPLRVATVGNKRYFISMVDDKSHRLDV